VNICKVTNTTQLSHNKVKKSMALQDFQATSVRASLWKKVNNAQDISVRERSGAAQL